MGEHLTDVLEARARAHCLLDLPATTLGGSLVRSEHSLEQRVEHTTRY